ncbi:MAG: Amino-acid carrier protein AlsT [Chlamydiales bacterium]|nr:Amino-acid carrier protein AlsT [Chlamydiales bacterium]MCH9619155.1 Amino-acid carrier protein AlsT [Chlamydiales bacterium]MCH9622417.1 Amino-acid carrier protein AlsT [Chlamydiales bacterium]
MELIHLFQKIDQMVWQPLFVIIIGIGLYLTFKLRGLQFRYLWHSLKLVFKKHDDEAKGDITQFQALTTALAATIGIGNIAGVATAISMGGIGSLLWIWVTCLIGMSTKYSEATLAIKYRVQDRKSKEMSGGPMYYIHRGLGWKKLAASFAFFGAVATITTGNLVQSNSIASAISGYFHISDWVTGLVLALCTGAVLIGGIKSIGKVTSFLVPIMAVFYILGSLLVIGLNFGALPAALKEIFSSAFTGQAAVGGFAGSSILLAVQMGVSRGVFSNESGLGSAPIAAAAAKTDYPSRQALISMVGAFLSTVVCTFTGLAIAVTHVLGQNDSEGRVLKGAYMTVMAFERGFPYGGAIVIVGCILFGLSTIIGWAYYGEKCCEYLFGPRSVFYYRLIFTLSVFFGVLIPLEVIWPVADIANAFMALPNLIGVLALAAVVSHETDHYFRRTTAQELIQPM